MDFYQRKLYALLHDSPNNNLCELPINKLEEWWNDVKASVSAEIASSSDRVNLQQKAANNSSPVKACHPISGQTQDVGGLDNLTAQEIDDIRSAIAPISTGNAKKLFWWFWRFYPELVGSRNANNKNKNGLLFPAHRILPDCPWHSYRSTVSALAGAMFPKGWETTEKEGLKKHEQPYLLIFTFSPVQEFIKSSRKFLDFWAGSYLLHYLGVKLCWHIADRYGPDAIITPSLWSQEIIDALMLEKFKDSTVFQESFKKLFQSTPVEKFNEGVSTSLSTAGFPNIMIALVPGKKAAKKLGKELILKLKKEWVGIGKKVQEDIKKQVREYLDKTLTESEKRDRFLTAIADFFPNTDLTAILEELQTWQQPSCWEWNRLWEAQLSHAWEPYWTAIPLGNPDREMQINRVKTESFPEDWIAAQTSIAQSNLKLPSEPEKSTYELLNVGTWWGSLQARLGESLRAVKNLRTWQIPPAPGERSTISGQFSAAHPRLKYRDDFCEGGGLPASSMRLFWFVMQKAYPGLFNGSEKLNCLELTKRMAWVYGGVAESLGIDISSSQDYETWIRFPNLSSIASARFACDRPDLVKKYWQELKRLIDGCSSFDREQKKAFESKTRRPFQVPKTDSAIAIDPATQNRSYNGTMFSSKWLADDMGLQKNELETLKRFVEETHQKMQFGEGSPADWWAIVLADGDGMGDYVSGENLKYYKDYIVSSEIEPEISNQDEFNDLLNKTKKRMGPATHVGLNRALLDFSNRLVPYLTEQRFCGKVIYSGGDDVMAIMPLEDLPEYLLSLRAAWSGKADSGGDKDPNIKFVEQGGYWQPEWKIPDGDRIQLPDRPLFTMGADATISMGIVIAYKTVPLPTVLESLWEAEKDRAKKLLGKNPEVENPTKDGLCFRVIYGGGNQLEALMKGHLLSLWWDLVKNYNQDLSPLLYRLAEELPRRAVVTDDYHLFSKAAKVILSRRDESKKLNSDLEKSLIKWLDAWEDWVKTIPQEEEKAIGTKPEDLGKLLRFSAFWVDKMVERETWKSLPKEENS
ncbi:type III-B CRISPR-associated protein Cas10/Cmr2 [Aerosakkonema funiforme]|uniref:type III-B CRISPR-associated protein Cas10/Cmr2 n=1 Tax=Aerosakkonema funiforme TaxID=1246630 RepID=UPI0035B86BC4